MHALDLQAIRTSLIEVADRAGDLIMQLFHSDDFSVKLKADNSPVTDADLRANDFITRELSSRFPDLPIASEEQTQSENKSAMRSAFIIVDPLDSTKNFATGIPFFDVTIALISDGAPLVGVIRDPVHRATYSAVRGGGAWRGQHKMLVRSCSSLEDADLDLNVTRLPRELYQRFALNVAPKAKKVRYFGSAVLEACWVADGIIDGVINHDLSAWDIAAVTLVLDEAGGVWGDLRGDRYRLDSLKKQPFFAVGDRRLMNEILEIVHDA